MDCKCRIVSDGTARGTKVLDADGNESDLVELIAHYKTTKSYGNV